MTSQPGQRLAHDHAALDELLKQLQQAVDAGDLEGSLAKLDLFWARLAVHIRAEHHHLFPAVIARSKEIEDEALEPSLSQAESTVDRLRADHDFFMHELAQAIRILRDMAGATSSESVADGFKAVRNAIIEIEKRLAAHNEIEESQIYCWATALFDRQQQMELSRLIDEELAYHPPRFPSGNWSNST